MIAFLMMQVCDISLSVTADGNDDLASITKGFHEYLVCYYKAESVYKRYIPFVIYDVLILS